VLVWTYCPRCKVEEQSKADAAPYGKWEAGGSLVVTEGEVVDYRPMQEQVLWAAQTFDLAELAYDTWNSTHLTNELADEGINLVEVPQNTHGMYPGSKKLEELVYSGRLIHGGNPVLRWAAGNVRPDKKRSKQKGRIDPIVAVVMALSRASAHNQQDLSDFLRNPIVF